VQINLKKLTVFFSAIILSIVGCTTPRYPHKASVTDTEETQIACETYGRMEKEIVYGDSVSGMLIGGLVVGPLILFALPQWLMGFKPAIENDKRRDEIFSAALKDCVNPNAETADLIRVAGGRYYARKDYAEAEVLYRRALAIEGKLPQEEVLARLLEDYGQLMWVTDRRVEGQEMLLRARSIRAKLDREKQTQFNVEGTGSDDNERP
jgi:hypothetical protein